MKVISQAVLISVLVYLLLEHAHRRVTDLLDAVELRGYRWIEEVEQRIRRLLNDSLDQSRSHLPLQNPYGASTCSSWFGCSRGHCWSGCAGAFPSVTGPEWCYTTNSTGRISCRNDRDCHGCWRCSSACSV